MKFDHNKLEGLIKELHAQLKVHPNLVMNAVAIGKIDGLQIQIRVEKDRFDQLPNRKGFCCIEKSP